MMRACRLASISKEVYLGSFTLRVTTQESVALFYGIEIPVEPALLTISITSHVVCEGGKVFGIFIKPLIELAVCLESRLKWSIF